MTTKQRKALNQYSVGLISLIELLQHGFSIKAKNIKYGKDIVWFIHN